jgi:hypothetical protein
MSDRSHAVGRLAEDEQDVLGQAVAGVLEQEPDHLLDGGAQVGQGQRRGHLVVEQQPVAGLELDVLQDPARVQA